MSPSATSDGGHTSLRTIPLAYDISDSEKSARSILFALFPDWQSAEGPVEFVKFKDGITNTLLKAIKRRPGYTGHQIDEEAVLLRAYGSGTDVLIDREREARSHSLLARRKLAPELLARFDNGLLYRFIEGQPCTPEDLRQPKVWRATAQRLGEWHGLLSPDEAIAASGAENRQFKNINQLLLGKPIPNVWTILQKWILALPNDTDELRSRNEYLQSELETMTKRLGHATGIDQGRYVLGHCDLLSANVIMHPGDSNADGSLVVSFIDYEYATPAPAAFDLANHFSEWAGFECNFSVVPTKSQRRAFLETYVASFRSYRKPEAESLNGNGHVDPPSQQAEVDCLMQEVDDFRGVPGLYWGVWALIQATISDIDFDYVSYAATRLGEYKASKAEIEGSRKSSGQEMPLRERRWAQE